MCNKSNREYRYEYICRFEIVHGQRVLSEGSNLWCCDDDVIPRQVIDGVMIPGAKTMSLKQADRDVAAGRMTIPQYRSHIAALETASVRIVNISKNIQG